MLFRSSAYWQPESSNSESDQDVSMKTPTKNRTCSEVQHSASKVPRPGAPGGSDFKSPGVQSKDLNKSPGVQSNTLNKAGGSEFKSPGLGEMQKQRPKKAAPGSMGTCQGVYPPRRKKKPPGLRGKACAAATACSSSSNCKSSNKSSSKRSQGQEDNGSEPICAARQLCHRQFPSRSSTRLTGRSHGSSQPIVQQRVAARRLGKLQGQA